MRFIKKILYCCCLKLKQSILIKIGVFMKNYLFKISLALLFISILYGNFINAQVTLNLNQNVPLFSIETLSDSVLWVGSSNGNIFKSSNQGQLWVEKNLNINGDITKIKFLNDQVGFVLINNSSLSSGSIMRTIDYGENWSEIASCNVLINDFYILNVDTIFYTKYGTPVLFQSFNGGNSWNNISVDSPPTLINGHGYDLFSMFLYFDFMYSSNYGNSWILKNTFFPSILPQYMYAINAHIPNGSLITLNNEKIAFTISDLILILSDPYTDYSLKIIPSMNPSDYTKMAIKDSIICCIINSGTLTPTSFAYISKDYGSTWISRQLYNGFVDNVSISDNHIIYVPCQNGKVWKYDIINDIPIINENQIKIFPNPVQSILHFELSNEEIKEVEVFNMMGQKLKNYFINDVKFSIDFSEYSSGIYFMNIKGDKKSICKKIIKN
jgi:hypothetical protein